MKTIPVENAPLLKIGFFEKYKNYLSLNIRNTANRLTNSTCQHSNDFSNYHDDRISSHNCGIYCTFLLLGAATLFPWLSFITAVDYFSVTSPHIEYLFAVCYGVFIMFGIIWNVFRDRKNVGHKHVGQQIRWSLVILGGLMTIPILLICTNSRGWVMEMLPLCAISIIGFVTVNLQYHVFGLAAVIDERYTVALNIGQGISGVTVSFLRVITKAVFGGNSSPLVYFLLTTFEIVITFMTFQRMQYKVLRQDVFETMDKKHLKTIEIPSYLILSKIWPMWISVVTIYTICITCFPGIATNFPRSVFMPIVDVHNWFSIIQITAYSLGDLLGKSLTHYVNLKHRTVYCGTILHIIFPILFFLGLNSELLPSICKSLWYPVSITFFLGCSTGFLACNALIHGCMMIDDLSEAKKEKAGSLMVSGLMFGITLGSGIGLLIGFMK